MEKIDEIRVDVKDIKEALLGTKYNKEGLVHKVEMNTKFRNRSGWWATFFTGLGVTIGKLIDKLF